MLGSGEGTAWQRLLLSYVSMVPQYLWRLAVCSSPWQGTATQAMRWLVSRTSYGCRPEHSFDQAPLSVEVMSPGGLGAPA